MRIVTLLALLLSLMANAARAAAWEVEPAPSDDPDMLAATVRNEDGHALFLWSRYIDGRYQLFAELHLASGQTFGRTMPIYRIDGGDPVDTNAIREEGDALGAVWGYVGKTAAFWLLWTSIQDTVLPGDRLHHWFEGQELEITYRETDGTERSTRFTLSGARQAVIKATGLKAK